jgi:hypothetical protein
VPSTLVHAAVAVLLACSLLGPAFSRRALAVVVGAVVLVDFDVFLGLYAVGTHRAAFHTLLVPALAAVALAVDGRRGQRLVERFGPTAPRVAWVTVAAVVVAAIGPDLLSNGVNVFYPVHDQFYAFDGTIRLSDRRGIVQSFVDLSEPSQNARGSTTETQYRTGVDPAPDRTGADREEDTERLFLVVDSGLQLLLVVTGAVVGAVRLREDG